MIKAVNFPVVKLDGSFNRDFIINVNDLIMDVVFELKQLSSS